MNDYLLILSLGPVQGFIASARRSRDLWSGSWLLSEIAKAAAQTLAQSGAELVFPAPGSPLTPDSELSVGNKVQVVLPKVTENEVRKRVTLAARAARQRFCEIAEIANPKTGIRQALWQMQRDDYVEVYAGWAQITEDGYPNAVKLANQALAARKATRDFSPSARLAGELPYFGLPKSSLDGARESVIASETGQSLPLRIRRRLRLSENEQLDCAGITKRLGGNSEQFTPFSRIAAHPWLETLPEAALVDIGKVYEDLITLDLATRVSGNGNYYRNLPYDGQLLYPSRLDAMMRDEQADEQAVTTLKQLKAILQPLWKHYGEPCPYGVILLADGDKMGALLSEVQEREEHIAVTRALSDFAGAVPARVRLFQGHAIYAGGDDVLAFVPLNRAFDCANDLRQHFARILQQVAADLGARNQPTLSVGLAIGHIMEPLGTLRELASRAEKLAKGDSEPDDKKRNALGILLSIRSGATTGLRLRWDDTAGQEAFLTWQHCFAPQTRRLPSRLAYDARQIHQRTGFALQGELKEPGIQAAEFARLLDRARTENGYRLDKKEIEALKARQAQLNDLGKLADELIIARWLAARSARDLAGEWV